MNKPTFRYMPVTIKALTPAVKNGKKPIEKEVYGYVHDACPYLAVTPVLNEQGKYTLTHLPTGRTLGIEASEVQAVLWAAVYIADAARANRINWIANERQMKRQGGTLLSILDLTQALMEAGHWRMMFDVPMSIDLTSTEEEAKP